MRTRVLIPSGVLGLGFSSKALARGVAAKPDVICIDGGSTDSGPYYLGTGTSKYARATCKAEWRDLYHLPLTCDGLSSLVVVSETVRITIYKWCIECSCCGICTHSRAS